jgi:glycosyltransferase involved in cell wall biosynthesis
LNILILDAWLPTPDRDSASLRMANLLAVLRELGGRLTLAADDLAARRSGLDPLQAAGIRVVRTPAAEHLAQEGTTYDVVVLSRIPVAQKHHALVQTHAPQARIIFDTTDLHHVRAFRAAKLTGDLHALRSAVELKRAELAMVRAADVTLVVSPVEKATLEQECPGARVHVVSNIHRVHGSAAPFQERTGIVFVGAFPHHPNADAMQYFFDDVYPRLSGRLSAAVTIIGSEPPPWLRAMKDPNVIVAGHVRDLASHLNRCRLTLAPLRYGAGVKGKVLESMAYGVPVVATPIAVEGIPADSGRDLPVAKDAAGFAEAVVELHSNAELWGRLSANGLALIQNHFSAAAARAALVRVLRELGVVEGIRA